ncbi:MAG: hypothetical protein COV98_04240 [Candidatus Altarchaeum sp. CG12_big_fil_rev_8_21_14_0_65_33_22]|uniref:CBS domain-containing protein n=1 Tax=Candidatus Altarchaeum hamiconexum TaxID=1803513 RepID=A0A8J7YU17_9ARCH|nr:CBS domain-containing protein [Candidatus Altarchaeum hamiconexum]NCN69136.1 CBS domain-containing protein [Candidatus Altarchaeum hamiconexum]PIN67187.1 MAG: hypothetical protein COV98_04240 [Candidatus Altarchaeum sp. CG12_big_fil_rev_8_21_14_0_65_33_22]
MTDVKDIMKKDIMTIDMTKTIEDALNEMIDKKTDYLIVVSKDKKQNLGVVTERDIIYRAVKQGLDMENIPITAIMTSPVKTINENAGIKELVESPESKKIRRRVVIDDKRNFAGVVDIKDIIKAIK